MLSNSFFQITCKFHVHTPPTIFRFFFLCRQQLLSTLCETKDATQLQPFIKILFPGIARLELDDIHDAYAMMSNMDERVPFLAPIRAKDSRGCVEKWMLQVTQIADCQIYSLSDCIRGQGQCNRNDNRNGHGICMIDCIPNFKSCLSLTYKR